MELDRRHYRSRSVSSQFHNIARVLMISAALGVKLGHRRVIYRQIATLRGKDTHIEIHHLIYNTGLPQSESLKDASLYDHSTSSTSPNCGLRRDSFESPSGSPLSPTIIPLDLPRKRRYKRHPKPDDNAPPRPPSAYVLFANMVREEEKSKNLSFTQLARLVGEKWKSLGSSEKEDIEAHAADVKKQYTADVTVYKKSLEYHLYQTYLTEFKERATRDEKPEKLEPPRKTNRRQTEASRPPYEDRSRAHSEANSNSQYTPYPTVHSERSTSDLSNQDRNRTCLSISSILHAPAGPHSTLLPLPAGYFPDGTQIGQRPSFITSDNRPQSPFKSDPDPGYRSRTTLTSLRSLNLPSSGPRQTEPSIHNLRPMVQSIEHEDSRYSQVRKRQLEG